MGKELQLLEEDMQKLKQMNHTLFDSWQDQLSAKFSVECVGNMEKKWKEYNQYVESLFLQLHKIEREMKDLSNNIKNR